jgi:hypothetical protein
MSKGFSLAAGHGWIRSSRCESGHCVEVARQGHGVALRNSTAPDQHLMLSAEAWRAFLAGLRSGEFDMR